MISYVWLRDHFLTHGSYSSGCTTEEKCLCFIEQPVTTQNGSTTGGDRVPFPNLGWNMTAQSHAGLVLVTMVTTVFECFLWQEEVSLLRLRVALSLWL